MFGYTRSYFHVDLPVVSAAVSLLRTFMPGKPVDELYTVLGRAKQGKTERYYALRRHLDQSFDVFVHAPGQRGLVMVVFTLPSHDLVFKVIRDRFGPPKNTTRAEVMEKYKWVFEHDRVGRLVDAQEYKQLRLPKARFMPDLLQELLTECGSVCRIDGDDLIVGHCYVERRLRPLDLFLRDEDSVAAERALLDYGEALRELARIDVFPGDLLLKNFGVTSQGKVVFYDYDEVTSLRECNFRELPVASNEEEEMSAEPWFFVGEHDVFPEQWLPFLGIPPELLDSFKDRHGDIILKPLYGNGGAGVFRLDPNDRNFNALYELFAGMNREPLIAQKFLPAVEKGDKRIILVDGEVAGAVNRVPAADETRSNLHVGGVAAATELTARDREICARLGPELKRRGLLFTGIDVIGDYLTEINVTSPTGIRQVEAFGGPDIAALIWDAIEAKVAR